MTQGSTSNKLAFDCVIQNIFKFGCFDYKTFALASKWPNFKTYLYALCFRATLTTSKESGYDFIIINKSKEITSFNEAPSPCR